MTATVPAPRAITASTVRKFALANVVVADAAGNDVVCMSRDRSTIFAVGTGGTTAQLNTKLRQSTDDGVTWTDVHTFPEQCSGIVELDDGEVLVATQNSAAQPAYVYKSSGWKTSHTSATWTKVLTTAGGYIRPMWNMNQFSIGTNGIVVVSTYGVQTTSAGAAANVGMGRYVCLSTDFGATFNLIYDLYNQTQAPAATGVHVHSTAYDEAWDRIWLTFGDNTGQGATVAGAGNMQIAYSDDRGATWNYLPCPAEWAGAGSQQVAIAITKSAIVLLPDGIPYGIVILPRVGYRKLGALHVGPLALGNTGVSVIGQAITKAYGDEALPMLASGLFAGTPYHRPTIYVSSSDGVDWQELWFDTAQAAMYGSFGITYAVGPTLNGKIVAGYAYTGPSATWKSAMLTADLVAL